jgi:hypothetical protein
MVSIRRHSESFYGQEMTPTGPSYDLYFQMPDSRSAPELSKYLTYNQGGWIEGGTGLNHALQTAVYQTAISNIFQ